MVSGLDVYKNYGMEDHQLNSALPDPRQTSRLDDVPDYVTKDGSIIRELLHPSSHTVVQQSLAEAVVHPGQTTALHRHHRTEEIYHITRGRGSMTLGESRFEVNAGHSIVIAPGTVHCIENTGDEPLHILCACSPAYSHEDTELLSLAKKIGPRPGATLVVVRRGDSFIGTRRITVR
jgi:mannose-6-phosphate isomerase-like protein (cupin superfamily)